MLFRYINYCCPGLVLTKDGEPMALMVPIPEGYLEGFVVPVSQARAQLALVGFTETQSKVERIK